MQLGGAGHPIWLNALSIDQANHAERTSMMKIMFNYSNTKVMSVLPPSTDLAFFRLLQMGSTTAHKILLRLQNFLRNEEFIIKAPDLEHAMLLIWEDQDIIDSLDGPWGEYPGHAMIGPCVVELFGSIIAQELAIDKSTYKKRAWTF